MALSQTQWAYRELGCAVVQMTTFPNEPFRNSTVWPADLMDLKVSLQRTLPAKTGFLGSSHPWYYDQNGLSKRKSPAADRTPNGTRSDAITTNP